MVPAAYWRWLDCGKPPACSVKVWALLERIFERRGDVLKKETRHGK